MIDPDEGADVIGKVVSTPYGEGRVEMYRPDGVYIVHLSECFNGTLYTQGEDLSMAKQPGESCMELNVAYEALEQMRRLNLEVECMEAGCGITTVDHEMCTTCLLSGTAGGSEAATSGSRTMEAIKSRFRLKRMSSSILRGASPTTQLSTAATPCLACGSPTCPAHSSATFQKENITVCNDCERFFGINFIIDCAEAPSDEIREKHVRHMIDTYDRAKLVLQYSTQYIVDDIATALESNTERSNKIGLGSNTAGVVSGITGVVACATILTPAGPPLLIASLLFGGSATAVSTGSDVANYFSEPNRVANRIIALHGLVHGLVTVSEILRDAFLREKIHNDPYEEGTDQPTAMELLQGAMERHGIPLKTASGAAKGYTMATVVGAGAATTAEVGGIGATAAAELGGVAAKNSRFFSRGAAASAQTLRFARFAGGALSAACLAWEAKEMHATIQNIRAGNPCEKADLLRSIRDGMKRLPDTADLEEACQNYLAAMGRRLWNMEEADDALKEIEANALPM